MRTPRRGAFWHDRRRTRPTRDVPWARHAPAQHGRLWDACAALTDVGG
jgi:hypothetical protein